MTNVATAALDPFSRVYKALVDDVLKAHRPLAKLVNVANWITFEGDSEDPEFSAVSDADMPELQVRPAGGPIMPSWSSSSARFDKVFIVGVTTDDHRVKDLLFPITWEIARALAIHSDALTIKPHINTELLNPIDVSESNDLTENDRGTRGWTAILGIPLRITIAKDKFLAEEPEL